jgi:hypothetical protein
LLDFVHKNFLKYEKFDENIKVLYNINMTTRSKDNMYLKNPKNDTAILTVAIIIGAVTSILLHLKVISDF